MTLLIDTAAVAAPERVEFWSQASCDAYHPLHIRTEEAQGFSARMWAYDLASIGVFRIAAAANTMSRTRTAIAAGDSERLQLSIQLRGRLHAEQENRTSVVSAGDITSYETSRPASCRAERPFESLVFSLPKELLRDKAAQMCNLTAVRIPGHEGLPRLAVQFFRGVFDGLADGTISRHDTNVAERVVDLVLGVYADRNGEPAAKRPTQAALLLHAKAFIEANLDDPELDPEKVARSSFISTRYLHKLFQAEGLTVCEWIRTMRLDRCQRDLLNPRLADHTILEIASRWGLPSAPHFSRLFHATYGRSPREYRREGSNAEQ